MNNILQVGAITAAKISSALLAMIAAILAARMLSVSEFGTVSLILSASVVIAAIIDWGSAIYVRKRSKYFALTVGRRVGESLGVICLGLIFRFCMVLLAIVFASFILGPSRFPFIYIAIGPIAFAFCLELLSGELLRVRSHFVWAEYYGGGLRQTVYVAVLALGFLFGTNLYSVILYYGVSIIIASSVSLFFVGRVRLPRRARASHGSSIKVRSERRTFLIIGLLNILLNQLPLLIAGFGASEATAGIVRVAMLFGLLMQMAISANAMFYAPKISAAARGDDANLAFLLKQSSRLGLVGLPAGLMGALLTPWLIPLMFGPEYSEAISGAIFLIGVYALLSVFGAYGQFVLLRGGERVAQGAAVVAVAGQLLLLPVLTMFWEVNGFVIAYGLSMLVSYAYLGAVGRRVTGISPGPF